MTKTLTNRKLFHNIYVNIIDDEHDTMRRYTIFMEILSSQYLNCNGSLKYSSRNLLNKYDGHIIKFVNKNIIYAILSQILDMFT